MYLKTMVGALMYTVKYVEDPFRSYVGLLESVTQDRRPVVTRPSRSGVAHLGIVARAVGVDTLTVWAAPNGSAGAGGVVQRPP